jgi:hypothetical protein
MTMAAPRAPASPPSQEYLRCESGNSLSSSSSDCPQICPGEVRATKRLKEMVGTRRLELPFYRVKNTHIR